MDEWRECAFAGTPVDERVHPCARECRAHLGFGDYVLPHRCGICPIPALVEALEDTIPVLDACATIIESKTGRHSDDQDECQACMARQQAQKCQAALAAVVKAKGEDDE